MKKLIEESLVTLVGNPNVGKSTLFNNLTGLKQHTGNWTGKTVESAKGDFTYKNQKFTVIDTPGTYSLFAKSKDEEVARDFICFEKSDATVVVCDATCLERNLNLVLQISEIIPNLVLCVNLIDEAKLKGININIKLLQKILNIPVVKTNARDGKGVLELKEQVLKICSLSKNNLINNTYYSKTNETNITHNKNEINKINKNNLINYNEEIEKIIYKFENKLELVLEEKISARWVCLQIIQNNVPLLETLEEKLEVKIPKDIKQQILSEASLINYNITDSIINKIIYKAEEITNKVVKYKNEKYNERDLKIDKIVTSKKTGIPIMILILSLIFWITIIGSAYPSELLSTIFLNIENKVELLLSSLNLNPTVQSFFLDGVYKVLTWIVAVMLPSMAIFFPLFTILEDLGYLSRVAFNLDNKFKNCNTCGKQALTMAMGFGCNCVGITGTRIIDSPRERLIAILTNNFVPCNGRFPILISVISMFLVGGAGGLLGSFGGAIFLTLVIIFGIFMTFLISKLLSKTILKGMPSNFTLELPPYRKPKIFRTIYNSIFNRTIFVLGRAIVAAIPAGIIIWIMANITYNDVTLIQHFSNFLDPFAKIMGLDGIILMAFILGFPANEIVIPVMIMGYISSNTLVEYENISELKRLLLDNGWTINTAVSTILFTIFHFPCSTACLTVKKETGSWKWTFVAFILPTLVGILICSFVTLIFKVFNF